MAPPPSRWHVSPLVDTMAYHWSWVLPLALLSLMGPKFPQDYLWPVLIVLGLNFAHQAVTVPLVYMDGEVFRRDARRYIVLPGLLLAGFLAMFAMWNLRFPPNHFSTAHLLSVATASVLTAQAIGLTGGGAALTRRSLWIGLAALACFVAAWLSPDPEQTVHGSKALLGAGAAASVWFAWDATGESRLRRLTFRYVAPAIAIGVAAYPLLVADAAVGVWPEKRFRARDFIQPVSAIAYVWNFWHVYRQKYGILRMHAGKSGTPLERAVPARIDEALVFGFLPLTMVVIGPANRAFLVGRFRDVRGPLVPLIDWLTANSAWLLPLTSLVALATVIAWLRAEYRASGLQNPARLSAGLGMIALSSSLLWADPVKAVVAFGFSHVTEYFVFVWAWERKYYATPRKSLLAYAMKWPGVCIFGFAFVVSGVQVLAAAWGYEVGKGRGPLKFGEITLSRVIGSLAMFQAMFHFYVDGFLWKMRRPVVRENL